MSVVPVIDISRAGMAGAWREAFSTVGFCRIVGHGLKVERLRALSRAFFKQPAESKERAAAAAYGLNGYTAKGREAVGVQRADPVESLVFNRGLPAGSEGQIPAELREAAWTYYGECEGLVRRLMRLTAVSLGRPESFFDRAYERPSCALRLANYDTLDKSQELLYAAHTDYTGFTLLDAEPVTGLEIRLPATGAWVAVEPLEGSLVVNSGDLIRQWSDEVFHSTLHRVRNAGLPERSAIVFFSGPSDDTVVESRRHGPVLAGEHLRERLRRSNIKQ